MPPEVSAVSEAERGERMLQWGAATLESLSEPVKGGSFSAHVLRLPVGAGPALSHRHDGEEWLTLLSGAAVVQVGHERCLLLEGDSLHFCPRLRHSYANPASTPATLLVTCCPPMQL